MNNQTLKNFILYSILFYQICLNNVEAKYPKSTSIKRNYDTHHIKLELSFNEPKKSVRGIATITLTPLGDNFNQCLFHAKNMEIRDVLLDGTSPLKFKADSEIVVIHFPKSYNPKDTLHISISYFSIPEKGIYFNAPSTEHPDTPHQIFSHSEPIDARYWFPCYDEPDDKLTSEMIATVSEKYFLLSNGKLVSVLDNPADSTKTFHWIQEKPHVTYLISFVAGEYSVIQDTCEDLPIQYYVYPNQVEYVPLWFEKTPIIIDVFSQKFDYEYPWDKYAQIIVRNYKAMGMEHTSATTLTDKINHDKQAHLDINNDRLVSHELAHQWFGNLVTCKDWDHIWLNEGFATYAEIIFTEMDEGEQAAQYDVISQQEFYLEMEDSAFHQPLVFYDYLHPEELFNHIAYQKGSLVLHMLRNLIGDERFFKSMANYLQKFAFQSVETSDFIKVVEATTGENLNWFFDEWLYRGGHPDFVVSYDWLPDSNLVIMDVIQVQQDSLNTLPIFRMPVEIEIVTVAEKLMEKREVQSRHDTFRFRVPSKPLMVQFDKNNIILKTLKFIKTQDECIYQLLHDNHLWGRLDAIRQLTQNTIDTIATVEALTNALLNDPFWAVRKKAAYALETFKNENLEETFISGCRDPNSKVRSACVEILGYFDDPTLYPFFKKIATSDSSYWVITEALYALIKIPDSLDFDFIYQFIHTESYNDMIRTAAFEGFRELKDKRSIPIALEFAKDSMQPFSRRYSSLKLIEEVGIGDNTVENLLIDLLQDSDEKVRRKVIQILGDFKSDLALSALKKFDKQELGDSERRRVRYAIQKIEESFRSEE